MSEPVNPTAAAPSPAPAPEASAAAYPIRVLLVDDQALIGEAVRRMLASERDIQYRYVGNPLLALDTAKEFRPTVILSDLVMPQMDGLELVSLFRGDPETEKIPLIVLSSMEEAATKVQAFKHGANDYLVKLPDRLEVIARVRYHSAGYVSMLQRDAAYEALRQSQQLVAEDLEEAARYAQSLFPEPIEERVTTTWRYIPSAALGGDAFGYHWLDADTFVVYLLDVAGHGVGAALLSVSVLNILRSGSLRKTDFSNPGQVLARLNDAFPVQDHGGKYFTIWYGIYKPSTRELRYSGGGHPPALLFAAGADPASLGSTGPMPGVLPDLLYETKTLSVPAGAKLFVYSDGLYELRLADESVLTHDDLLDELFPAVASGADPLVASMARAERLCGEIGYADDVSVVQVLLP